MGSNMYNGDLSPNGDLNGSTPKIYGANPPPAWSSRKYSDSNLNIPLFEFWMKCPAILISKF